MIPRETSKDPSQQTAPSQTGTPIGILERLVQSAESARASDVHLQMRASVAEVLFRLDGVLRTVEILPEHVAERVFGRIKFLAKLKTYQELLPQDGRIDMADIHSASDIRVATYPTVTGEKIVLRLFSSGEVRTFGELEFPEQVTGELGGFLK